VREPHRALENMVMTYNVLEYCRQSATPIIFSSSREVYGDIHRFDTEETTADFAYTESTYSASKIAGEALIYSYSRCYDLPYLVFRFSNVYGRYDTDIGRMVRVIPLFVQRISRDLPITVYGADKILDFTHVDDCVEGIVRGIEGLATGKTKNETINLAYGEGHTLVRMAELVGETLGKTPDITVAPALLGEVTHYVANIGKATSMLGYTPAVSLEEGIPKAVKWQLDWMASAPRPDLPQAPEDHLSAIDQGNGAGLAFKKTTARR
jgi:UDP-glucose 4-epimerase